MRFRKTIMELSFLMMLAGIILMLVYRNHVINFTGFMDKNVFQFCQFIDQHPDANASALQQEAMKLHAHLRVAHYDKEMGFFAAWFYVLIGTLVSAVIWGLFLIDRRKKSNERR